MPSPVIKALERTENWEFIHGLMEQRLARGELQVPLLPEVAMRVVRLSAEEATSAAALAAVIGADPALTMSVLRVATSAAARPATPIVSMQQAVAWLGFEEVSSIALTLAVQGRILNVPGHNHKARRLWRHALASALWSRQLALMLARDPAMAHLCGLLHGIGKPVALAAVHEIVQRAQTKLTSEEYDRLIETFHRPVGAEVVKIWGMPPAVLAALLHWEAYEAAGEHRIGCNIVNVAHRLADLALSSTAEPGRELSRELPGELLMVDPAYAALGFEPADGAALFDAAASILADINRYLPT
jgi:HD-like signal output (HDOD) protein